MFVKSKSLRDHVSSIHISVCNVNTQREYAIKKSTIRIQDLFSVHWTFKINFIMWRCFSYASNNLNIPYHSQQKPIAFVCVCIFFVIFIQTFHFMTYEIFMIPLIFSLLFRHCFSSVKIWRKTKTLLKHTPTNNNKI